MYECFGDWRVRGFAVGWVVSRIWDDQTCKKKDFWCCKRENLYVVEI